MDNSDSFEFMNIKAVHSGLGKNKIFMYIFHQTGILDYFVVSLI